MNNEMTWEHHLHGNEDNKGLIERLSYRACLVFRLSKVVPKNRLKAFAEGIFFSILNYGIEVYGNVWGLSTYDEQQRNSPAFTKEDNRRLQILVNKVLRCITGLDRESSIVDLHNESGQLSVQQRCAFFSILMVHKSILEKQPVYHSNYFANNQDHRITRRGEYLQVNYRLSISRCSFFYRGSKLYNLLPVDITKMNKMASFKKGVKEWIRRNIPLIPT